MLINKDLDVDLRKYVTDLAIDTVLCHVKSLFAL